MSKIFRVMMRESNFRTALFKAESKEEAEALAEKAWSETISSYEHFRDDQELTHNIENVEEVGEGEIARFGQVLTEEMINEDLA